MANTFGTGTVMDSDRIYFRAASQTDADAIQALAQAFGCSQSQVVRFAMAEWLSHNFVKRIEFAQVMKEVKEAKGGSGQT